MTQGIKPILRNVNLSSKIAKENIHSFYITPISSCCRNSCIKRISIMNIAKISMSGNYDLIELQKREKKTKQTKPVQFAGTQNLTSVSNSQLAESLKAMNKISFKGGMETIDEYSRQFIIGKKEIRIPDLLNLEQDVHIPAKAMLVDGKDGKKEKNPLNENGIHITKKSNGDNCTEVRDDKGNLIFKATLLKNEVAPETVIYKQGKYKPEITIKDPSLGDRKIKMFAGSSILGEGFDFKMPGNYKNYLTNNSNAVSFKGNVAISTLNKEQNTVDAVDRYKNKNLQNAAIRGDYADLVEENQPEVAIPAGGFGERFYNLTREAENKPSYRLPTDSAYRIMASTLNMLAAGGLMDPEKLNISYLSQAGEIKGDGVNGVKKYKTDGGALSEALEKRYIDPEKDLVILNADIFTNADMTRTYHALKTLPNAALIIPFYPCNAERAKSFGLISAKKDEEGNLEIKDFIEKPAYTNLAPVRKDFKTDKDYEDALTIYKRAQSAINPNSESADEFMANPGMYYLSKEGARVLRGMGLSDDEITGLGAKVMPRIVQLCNEGRLVNDKGEKMKVYTVPLEAKNGKQAVWDDIGSAEAYLALIKDVAKENRAHKNDPENNKYYGIPQFVLDDFEKNTDLETSIVYSNPKSREKFENFKKGFGVMEAKGNIFVTK